MVKKKIFGGKLNLYILSHTRSNNTFCLFLFPIYVFLRIICLSRSSSI